MPGKCMHACAFVVPGNPLTQTSALFSKISVYSSSQHLTSDLCLSLQVFQAAPELMSLCLNPPECWDYWCVPQGLCITPFMFPVSQWLRNRPINVEIFFMQWGQLPWISHVPTWWSSKNVFITFGVIYACILVYGCAFCEGCMCVVFMLVETRGGCWLSSSIPHHSFLTQVFFLLNLGLVHLANLASWPANSRASPISKDWS